MFSDGSRSLAEQNTPGTLVSAVNSASYKVTKTWFQGVPPEHEEPNPISYKLCGLSQMAFWGSNSKPIKEGKPWQGEVY